jgi:choline dehydrogenase-like flavoprotein
MNTHYDVIVIGSGAGGAAAAHRLVEAGRSVLLLEKGGLLPRDGSTLDITRVVHRGEFLSREPWQDGAGNRVVPEEHFNVGGKTKWYGAALLRFAPHEFAADASLGYRAWPFGPETLESYYDSAERMLGVRRMMPEPDLAKILATLQRRAPRWRGAPMPMALDPRITAHEFEARHFDGFASVMDLKHDAQLALLEPLSGATNFTLRAEAEVAALLGDPGDATRITGVRTTDGRIFNAARVVLAAGALHSPRLLARYVRRHRLEPKIPGAALIGANLKLHLLTAMVSIGATRMDDLVRKTALLVNDAFPHSSVQPLGFDSELIATLMPEYLPRPLARALARRAYGFFLQTEDPSLPANRVVEVDDCGIERRVLDYDERRSPAALAEHRAFARAFARALITTGRASFTQRIGTRGTAHACGTLIAGTDARDSVVDAQGRVHGLRGLYVADGSILPRVSRVNPSLTIYAWGLRVGDLVAASLRRAPAAAVLAMESAT